jgi:hypothetical protein
MFNHGGIYDVIMRYSSLTPKLVPDNEPAPRGIGMKIFGIEGEKIWGEDKKTQDWTLNNYPILELRDAKTTNEIADSLERNWDNPKGFEEELKARPDADVACRAAFIPPQHSKLAIIAQAVRQAPLTSTVVSMPQYSQSAYRYGDYVFKFAVFPIGEEQKKQANRHIDKSDPKNIISKELRKFHAEHRVEYSFCVQLLQNLEEQPVEDIGIEWDEKKYPFEQVAKIVFEPQDSWHPDFRAWWDHRITVNSWHGLKEHQPLGSTNRTRRVVYAESRKLRIRVNGHSDYIEPASLEEVPYKRIAATA